MSVGPTLFRLAHLPCPETTACNSKLRTETLALGNVILSTGASDEQVPLGKFLSDSRPGTEQKLDSFFLVDSRQVEEERSAIQLRPRIQRSKCGLLLRDLLDVHSDGYHRHGLAKTEAAHITGFRSRV